METKFHSAVKYHNYGSFVTGKVEIYVASPYHLCMIMLILLYVLFVDSTLHGMKQAAGLQL